VNNSISSDDSNWFTTHTDNFVVTDLTGSTPNKDEDLESSNHTPDEGAETPTGPNWMSAAYSSTKVVIDVVKESSDVFPPLKSVASGLAAILKHYDVRPLSSFPSMMLMIALASNRQ